MSVRHDRAGLKMLLSCKGPGLSIDFRLGRSMPLSQMAGHRPQAALVRSVERELEIFLQHFDERLNLIGLTSPGGGHALARLGSGVRINRAAVKFAEGVFAVGVINERQLVPENSAAEIGRVKAVRLRLELTSRRLHSAST